MLDFGCITNHPISSVIGGWHLTFGFWPFGNYSFLNTLDECYADFKSERCNHLMYLSNQLY